MSSMDMLERSTAIVDASAGLKIEFVPDMNGSTTLRHVLTHPWRPMTTTTNDDHSFETRPHLITDVEISSVSDFIMVDFLDDDRPIEHYRIEAGFRMEFLVVDDDDDQSGKITFSATVPNEPALDSSLRYDRNISVRSFRDEQGVLSWIVVDRSCPQSYLVRQSAYDSSMVLPFPFFSMSVPSALQGHLFRSYESRGSIVAWFSSVADLPEPTPVADLIVDEIIEVVREVEPTIVVENEVYETAPFSTEPYIPQVLIVLVDASGVGSEMFHELTENFNFVKTSESYTYQGAEVVVLNAFTRKFSIKFYFLWVRDTERLISDQGHRDRVFFGADAVLTIVGTGFHLSSVADEVNKTLFFDCSTAVLQCVRNTTGSEVDAFIPKEEFEADRDDTPSEFIAMFHQYLIQRMIQALDDILSDEEIDGTSLEAQIPCSPVNSGPTNDQDHVIVRTTP